MSDFYDVLGVSKGANSDEIKKAYRKKAMQFHPDRNKGDTQAENKFKEINQAYDTLGDDKKKKQYDMFGSAGGNHFGGGGSSGNYSSAGFGGFEDMFGGMGGSAKGGSASFNMEDLFGSGMGGGFGGQQSRKQSKTKEKPISLDFEKTYEVPIFDLILGCKIEVKGVYGNTAKLKIPASTKPGTKFRVKGFGKKEPGKEGNLIVKAESLMPKNISDVDMSMLERIRENIGY